MEVKELLELYMYDDAYQETSKKELLLIFVSMSFVSLLSMLFRKVER